MSRRKIAALGTLLVLILALVAWMVRSPGPAPIDKAEQQRQTRAAARIVELKNSSLAALENRDFQAAEPLLIDLATMGLGEPAGCRNWVINRIAAASAMNEAKNVSAYTEALQKCRVALNLEWRLEPDGPVRYDLASKIESLSHNIPGQLRYLHIGAGRGQDDPRIWHELYLAERDSPDESIRADGENALKSLYGLVPNNLYVLLEWLEVQARRKDATIVDTLDRARASLLPFLADVPVATPLAADRALADASVAAKRADWTTVARDMTAVAVVGRVQPAVRWDEMRIAGGWLPLIQTDFSDKFYRAHPFDRVLKKDPVSMHFQAARLKDPIAGLTDVQDARFVDFDSDGRLEIAVLRAASLEIYRRTDSTGNWSKIAATPVLADGFEHLLAADLDRDASAPDFLLYGRAGLLVVENRPDADGKTRSLRPMSSSVLFQRKKGIESVVAVDLDHDGALDLVVAEKGDVTASGSTATVLTIWRNQGRMQFTDITARSGLAPTPSAARSLVAVNWNHDLDMDVLLAGSPAGAALLQGAGEGRFRLQPLAQDNAVFKTATRIAILDADANGSCDALAAGPSGMALLLTSSTHPGEVNLLGTQTISDFPASDLVVSDFDNDGCQDVIAWNDKAVRSFHGIGNGRFEPSTDLALADLHPIRSADCGDADGDGDLDLLVVTPPPDRSPPDRGPSNGGPTNGGRLHLLENDGGNRNNWIDVHLPGGPYVAGATLQLKAGVVCQSQVVTGPVTHFGIGQLESADILRIVWPNGIPADLLQPAKNRVIDAGRPPIGWR